MLVCTAFTVLHSSKQQNISYIMHHQRRIYISHLIYHLEIIHTYRKLTNSLRNGNISDLSKCLVYILLLGFEPG